ncbi:modulator of FtsH protease HflC [Candidatus Hakubella thermalkaliphila]|uniref:Protein HflC n=1 Tax=Candidatus Hakubella thermalkaliphila TaxID=2754717 RepID=A0A6V8Q420_9ACTN|nr:protease modulator HflC [Candidatus Hakubella thermalkaliphila]MBT9169818.1 Modulator of FtsH protease HflC [Actinomycetota bacterium]GFP19133.1 modulator of FtsH protease HflC [Candidatus Hakubella thermalkaliphila]GFP22755.1 modulator of FtsH protease HflC [Candidatus Hakubella thermalkaliphila]GFP29449.1 modulator of FtsH protease HflC [Candidatus Hakubella thermalkaliphila]GFP38814.1 modulator of FtsH protease HflC [Candidatus Hakubella thermalkaliphila]
MRKAVITIVVVLVALFVLSQAVFTIDEKEQAIILQLGKYVETIEEPGLNFKIPFIQTVSRMERRVLVADAPATEFITLDKERLVVDTYTRWRIVNPHLFYKAVRDEHGARLRLNSIAVSKLREELARYTLWDIIGIQRKPITETVRQHVNEVTRREFGIEVIDVRMKRADLPVEVQEAVFARMIAERDRMAKEARAEGAQEARKVTAEADKEVVVLLAEAEKESKILRGEGDAQAVTIYAAAFGKDPEFFSFVRSLEAYEKLLVGGTTLVLGSDSELFRYLESPQPTE